jgi:hypothetical protein
MRNFDSGMMMSSVYSFAGTVPQLFEHNSKKRKLDELRKYLRTKIEVQGFTNKHGAFDIKLAFSSNLESNIISQSSDEIKLAFSSTKPAVWIS